MKQNGSKYCSRRHPATSGVGQKIKHFFIEINYVEDQIGVYRKYKCQRSPTLDHIKGGKV